MPNLKKVISLHQAAQISGYHQDYLSSLIRKKEIKGDKMGRNWVTTEEEIKSYIFRQKIRNKNLIMRNFLLFCQRMNKSYVYAFACVLLFSVGMYFYNQQTFNSRIQAQAKAEHTQFANFTERETEEFKELKF